jgi:hemolysin III
MVKVKEVHPTSGFSLCEERWNAYTHLVGTLLSVVGLVVAVVLSSLSGDVWLIVACSVYGASLVSLHAASTLYHSARDLRWKRRWLAADHSCIYLLIAGTYTPFALGPLRGPVGWTVFGLIWGLAMLGIVREVLRPQRGTWLSTGIYLAMGWLVVVFFIPLARSLSLDGLIFLLVGGVLYSAGTLFYKWHKLKYHHAIWHLFVVAGAVCQYFAVLSLMRG